MNLNATIFGQMISFIFFVWFCMKYIWPPILLNIIRRKKKIKNSFKKIDYENKKIKFKKKIINIKKKKLKKYIKKIITKVYKEKLIIFEKNINNINILKKNILNKTNKEIKNMYIYANQKLLKEIKQIAILMIKKIIQKSFNSEKHDKFIEKLMINFKGI